MRSHSGSHGVTQGRGCPASRPEAAMCVHVQLGASLGSGQVLRAGTVPPLLYPRALHKHRASSRRVESSLKYMKMSYCLVTAHREPHSHRHTLSLTSPRTQSADAGRLTGMGCRGPGPGAVEVDATPPDSLGLRVWAVPDPAPTKEPVLTTASRMPPGGTHCSRRLGLGTFTGRWTEGRSGTEG